MASEDASKPKTGEDGGRKGEPNREGGADEPGHLSPQIDRNDPTAERGGQIAQDSQQSTGLGSGQS